MQHIFPFIESVARNPNRKVSQQSPSLKLRLFGLALATALSTGCGSNLADVQGTVTLDGNPIVGGPEVRGTVTFFPKDGKGVPSTGIIDENGKYAMSTVSDTGVPPGSYDVAVTATRVIIPADGGTPSGRPITPRRYASTKESQLHAEVQSGNNTIDFALESQPSK
jgi:hypothetical protein